MPKKKGEQAKVVSLVALDEVNDISFSDTYTTRDYEVILDLLYGLFNREESSKLRVFDPFVADTKRAPLITPRMLVERIEELLSEKAMPEAV